MTVFTVIHEDRHVDVGVTVFHTEAGARKYAKETALECERFGDPIDETIPPGAVGEWLYCAKYGPEGDGLRVEQKEVQP